MEVEIFSDEDINNDANILPIPIKIDLSKPKNNSGYTIGYVTRILSNFKEGERRTEFEMMLYSIIIEDDLLDFFKFKNLQEGDDYDAWKCIEIEKIKQIYDNDIYNFYTFNLLCQNLKLFFINPEKFYYDSLKF